jgi:NADPH-dependent curcumin reductase CurA
MASKNMQVLFASRPQGWVREDNFRVVETEIPRLEADQVLVKNIYLSLDPYMRGRMNEARGYARGAELGQVMVGETVGQVVESRHPQFKPGDSVAAYLGWQQYGVANGAEARNVDPKLVPLSAYLALPACRA